MSSSIMLSGNGELPATNISGISREAEERGFDGLWFGETTLRDASILAAVAACSTKKIQLGTSILNVFTRTPSQLALLATTLNELSSGRFTLGLGVSTAAIIQSWHGMPFQNPNHRLDETVKLLRQYFSGEKFSFQGRHASPTGARLRSSFPTKIALAALNDWMIMKAGQLADRVILNLYPPSRIAHAITLLDEGCHRAGKPRPTLSVMLYSYLVGDEVKGLEAGKDLVSFYSSAPAYANLFASLGYEKEANAMSEAWKARDKNLVKGQVTAQMIDALTVRGTVQNLRERVREYHDAGVDDVFICPSPFADYEANIDEVLQHYF